MKTEKMNKRQWIGFLTLFLSICFCMISVNKAAAYTKYTIARYTYDTQIYMVPGETCVIAGNDSSMAYYEYYGTDDRVASVDVNSGEVAAYETGVINIMILGYDEYDDLSFYAEAMVNVVYDDGSNWWDDYNSSADMDYNQDYDNIYDTYPDYSYEEPVVPVDMTNAILDRTSVKVKAIRNGYGSWYWYSSTVELNLLNTPEYVSEWMPSVDFTYKSSNENMPVNCYLYNNAISVYVSGSGTTTVEFTVNGKVLTCDIEVVPVYMSSNGIVLAKGKTKQLKVKNGGSDVVWESLTPTVATVSSTGLVTAKKGGTAVIIATIGEDKFGCAVNVTTASMKKVVTQAQNIAKGTYSQPKRMQEGYYDCSSLVWRAYSPYGIKFGNNSWAPVAADIGKWSMTNGKKISSSLTDAQIQKKKLKVGDLLFKTGSDNGRYKGIDHVEMFIGYGYAGMDYDGTVYLTTKLATRSDGYGEGMLVVRPRK